MWRIIPPSYIIAQFSHKHSLVLLRLEYLFLYLCPEGERIVRAYASVTIAKAISLPHRRRGCAVCCCVHRCVNRSFHQNDTIITPHARVYSHHHTDKVDAHLMGGLTPSIPDSTQLNTLSTRNTKATSKQSTGHLAHEAHAKNSSRHRN